MMGVSASAVTIASDCHSFRLYGLDAQTRYKIREQNVDKKRFWFDGGTFTGEYLNHAGINPNLNKIYDSAVFVLEAE